MGGTTTGLKENIAGVFCYALFWASGILFLIAEPNNKTIKFHAFQSIIVFGILTVIVIIFHWMPIVNIVVNTIVTVIGFILWIALMALAAQDKKYKLPIAGYYAEKWSA